MGESNGGVNKGGLSKDEGKGTSLHKAIYL